MIEAYGQRGETPEQFRDPLERVLLTEFLEEEIVVKTKTSREEAEGTWVREEDHRNLEVIEI